MIGVLCRVNARVVRAAACSPSYFHRHRSYSHVAHSMQYREGLHMVHMALVTGCMGYHSWPMLAAREMSAYVTFGCRSRTNKLHLFNPVEISTLSRQCSTSLRGRKLELILCSVYLVHRPPTAHLASRNILFIASRFKISGSRIAGQCIRAPGVVTRTSPYNLMWLDRAGIWWA